MQQPAATAAALALAPGPRRTPFHPPRLASSEFYQLVALPVLPSPAPSSGADQLTLTPQVPMPLGPPAPAPVPSPGPDQMPSVHPPAVLLRASPSTCMGSMGSAL